jgi:hypothetical protein
MHIHSVREANNDSNFTPFGIDREVHTADFFHTVIFPPVEQIRAGWLQILLNASATNICRRTREKRFFFWSLRFHFRFFLFLKSFSSVGQFSHSKSQTTLSLSLSLSLFLSFHTHHTQRVQTTNELVFNCLFAFQNTDYYDCQSLNELRHAKLRRRLQVASTKAPSSKNVRKCSKMTGKCPKSIVNVARSPLHWQKQRRICKACLPRKIVFGQSVFEQRVFGQSVFGHLAFEHREEERALWKEF